MSLLQHTGHFFVHTQSIEEEGLYIIASGGLIDRPDHIKRMITEAFHVEEFLNEDGNRSLRPTNLGRDMDEAQYILILSPTRPFWWHGRMVVLRIPRIELGLKEDRMRLVADGPQRRLSLAKHILNSLFREAKEDSDRPRPLLCVYEQQSHFPTVNKELRKIARATNRLAELIVESVHHVRTLLKHTNDSQELLESWYVFASEHGHHAQRYMDNSTGVKFTRLLGRLSISWLSFICDDCEPTERRTFKWAVTALEFTNSRIKGHLLHLPEESFKQLRTKVATCMSVLMTHYDVLGVRSLQATKAKEKQEEAVRQQSSLARAQDEDDEQEFGDQVTIDSDNPFAFTDPNTKLFWERISQSLREVEEERIQISRSQRSVGRVLDNEKPEDRSLFFLASSSSNVSMRWQQGRLIGSGAFGSVYLAVNLDTNSLMAVKEIKFQEVSGLPNLATQIKEELRVMEMLHHQNVVEYYGIEVHRDRVYIFEEYCPGGSLASLLEHGRIEDERIIQVYTMQMLDGLAYLHANNIVHRDVKPDSKSNSLSTLRMGNNTNKIDFSLDILLDSMGVIKFVDFGAAKIIVKNHRTMRSRRASDPFLANPIQNPTGGLPVNHSLTGTPMYMSPETIKNDNPGRRGAMDIWSLGCVALECATGKKPWSNLDNEWRVF